MPESSSLRAFDPDLTRRLLSHLGFNDPLGEPSAQTMRSLHHAFLDKVPYENLEIQLGRATTIDPADSAARIVTGRGGYCYHLNGTFATLLETLGYSITVVRAAVVRQGGKPGIWGEHALTLVDFPHETWVVDVGLGDGFRDPIPLVEATIRQAPFTYRLEHLGGLGWRFLHDELGTILGFDIDMRPMPWAFFEPLHQRQSTSPESSFVKLLTVQARRSDHVLILRGCVLTRIDEHGKRHVDIDKESEWWDLITGEFGLKLPDVGKDARTALWRRTRTGHEAWLRAGRP